MTTDPHVAIELLNPVRIAQIRADLEERYGDQRGMMAVDRGELRELLALADEALTARGPETIERVARAIHAAKHPTRHWFEQDEKRDDFRRYARAALAALEKP